MDDQEAVKPSRYKWPVLIVGGLAVFGAFTLLQFVFSLAFSLGRLLVLAAIVGLGVLFFRGPPDS